MTRTALAILNELSIPVADDCLSDDALEATVAEFVATLRAARGVRRDLALVSHERLSGVPVTADRRTLAVFLNQRGGRARELWRYILALRNHAPFSAAPSIELANMEEEYKFDEVRANGLGIASTNRQLAVSLQSSKWGEPAVELQRQWFEEKGDGDIFLQTEAVSATHAASPLHITEHEGFLRQITLPQVVTGDALWKDRQALYPHLDFLPRVERLLSKIPSGSSALKQIRSRLAELEGATATWDHEREAHPKWLSRITPEDEQRKRLCQFDDLDGKSRCFDLHARYTPGPGRIHFRLAATADGPRLVIAHIGPKLS